MDGSTANPLPSRGRSGMAESLISAHGSMMAGMTAAAKWMTAVSGVKPAFGTVPEGVEVYPRYGGQESFTS